MFGRGTSLSLSLSLVARTFWHTFGLNLKGFFTHFVVVFSHLIVNFSYFIVVFSRLFAYKRRFLGHFVFLKILNAVFVRFCALFVILSLCKKATQRVARRKPQQKNPQRLKENLLFLDTSLALSMTNLGKSLNLIVCHTLMLSKLAMTACLVILSVAKNPKNLRYALFMDTSLTLSMTRFMTQRVFGMTNSGFCLRITDIFTQILKQKFTKFISYTHILKQKFKFFIQNSRHFINSTHFVNSKHFTNSTHFINFTQNSTHFITLSQISSPTQGFFISLPQIFEQFLLINLVERRSYGSSWHKRQDKNSRTD